MGTDGRRGAIVVRVTIAYKRLNPALRIELFDFRYFDQTWFVRIGSWLDCVERRSEATMVVVGAEPST